MPHSKATEGNCCSAQDALADRSIGQRLHDLAVADLLAAEAQLARSGVDRHEGVHQARKCLRRTRAILALAQPGPGSRGDLLGAALARLCRGLSTLRDAQALLDMLARFGQEGAQIPAMLPDAIAAAKVQRDAMLARFLLRDPDLLARRQRIAGFRAQLERLDWKRSGDNDVARAMARSARRARKAGRQARKHPRDSKAWHRFRRRLRRLNQQNSVLAEVAPGLCLRLPALEHQAKALGEAQDCQLLLARCARRSPFAPALRPALRQLARQRLQQLRHDSPGDR